MDTYEDEMQRMLAQEMQQRARREQTTDAIAGVKENYAGAYAIPPLTPEERQLNADADAAAAIPLGEAAYKQKDQFYGQGLLGMGVAGLLNLGKKKKIANRVAIAGEGLSRSRRATELANQRDAKRAGGIAVLDPVNDIAKQAGQQRFTTEERLAGENFTRGENREKIKSTERKGNEKILYDSSGNSMPFVEDYSGVLTGLNGESAEGWYTEPPKDFMGIRGSRAKVTNLVEGLAKGYTDLARLGAAVTEGQTAGQNIVNFIRGTSLSTIEGAFGGEVATIREIIKSLKPNLIQAFKAAAEVGVKGMDTPAEIDFYMKTLGDETNTLEGNMAALGIFQDAYGTLDLPDDHPIYKLLNSPEIEAEKDRQRQEWVDLRRQKKLGANNSSGTTLIDPKVWDNMDSAARRRAQNGGFARRPN